MGATRKTAIGRVGDKPPDTNDVRTWSGEKNKKQRKEGQGKKAWGGANP